MISLPAGSRIWLAAGITDMRNGFNGLASKVQNVLKDDPFSGHYVPSSAERRGDQIKVLWADSDGLCLFTKRLERGTARLAGHPQWKGSPYSGSVVHAS